jgi:hypothetical protein
MMGIAVAGAGKVLKEERERTVVATICFLTIFRRARDGPGVEIDGVAPATFSGWGLDLRYE